MNSLTEDRRRLLCKDGRNDPPLTDGGLLESFLNLDDTDPVLSSLFEQFPPGSNLLKDSDCLSIFKEFDAVDFNPSNDDQNSHYTFTTIQSVENQDLLLTDFERKASASPQNQLLVEELDEFSRRPNKKYDAIIQAPITLDDILGDNAGTCIPSHVFNDFSTLQSANSETVFNFLDGSDAEEKRVQPKLNASYSDFFSVIMPQKNKSVKFTQLKSPYKVQKIKQEMHPDYVKNIIQKYNMELNHILVPDVASDTSTVRQSTSQSVFLAPNQEDREKTAVNTDAFFQDTQIDMPFRPSPGRPRKERRPTLLKKDANVTLDEKLTYYRNILAEAKMNNLPGIFLREQAVSEFCLEEFGNTPSYLTLVLSNFDAVQEFLDRKSLEQEESYRTIWRITRTQKDNTVNFEFFLSDELSPVPEEQMEISVFTLIVPGHTIKHLVTSSQYLEMVNFMLGKHYNHAINDNLAEATVGSDGKMIPTQKHHASRVRSHVKKYLKRHVIKDKRRYTEEDRRNICEFQYRTALHNIVMQSSVKKPFESKVSVALMELHNAKDALYKQAEFFIFKKLS